MSRLCLYYTPEPDSDRWLPGDRYVRPLVRRLLRGPRRPGGVDKVVINLRRGLDRIGQPYLLNLPFRRLQPGDRVGVFGQGRHCLRGYDRPNPIVAGIGLMTHPAEWPTLCTEYPVVRYLQHSAWCAALYRPWFGDRCTIWPVGIDTDHWHPAVGAKSVDFLLYDKIHWDRSAREVDLLAPLVAELRRRGLTWETVRYGHYQPAAYQAALGRSRAMIFLSAHESQGIAAQEAMSAGLPLLAWDPGWWLDPARIAWGTPNVPATSVPGFDERCGERFRDAAEFSLVLDRFLEDQHTGRYKPRDYILENLTLERCARHYLSIVDEAVNLSSAR